MKQDWKALAELSLDHLGGSIGTTVGSIGVGLLVAVVLVLLYWRIGILRRPANAWYNRLVKLYIPYLLVAGIIVGTQVGMYRSVRNAALAANDAAMAALYQHALGPVLGTTAARQAFLTKVQVGARSGQDLGKAITGAIKDVLGGQGPERSWSRAGAAMLAGWVIDRYEDDIASAVLYGIYLKAGGYLQLHQAGEPMAYDAFHEDVEYLLNVDLGQMEASIKGNLGFITQAVIEKQYKAVLKGSLLLGLLLALIPVVEWAIYTLVVRRRPQPVDPLSGADTVLHADDL